MFRLEVGILKKSNEFKYRQDDTESDLLTRLSNYTGMTRSDIIRLGMLKFALDIKKDLIIDGIDFKDVAETMKRRLLRKYISILKTEQISQDLFIERLKKDICKYIFYNKSNEQIVQLIAKYKAIGKTYGNGCLKEINDLIEKNKGTDNKIAWQPLMSEFQRSKKKLDWMEVK